MSPLSDLSLTILGILGVAYYIGAPDTPAWILIVGAGLLVAGLAFGARDWQQRRRRRQKMA